MRVTTCMSVLLLVPVIVYLFTVVSFLLFRKEYDVHQSGVVLITGTSTGIGRHAALFLAGKGFTIFAGVRNQKDADSFGEYSNVVPVIIDVTKDEEVDQAFEVVENYVKEHGVPFVGLINNAGISRKFPLEGANLDDFKWLMEINVVGVVRTTNKFLPLLRESRGRIINIGSLLGEIALPFTGEYAASKYALRALSDTWRRELAPWGVYAGIVQPSYVKSDIQGKNNDYTQKRWDESSDIMKTRYDSGISPAAMAKSSLQKESLYVPSEYISKGIYDALTNPYPQARYLLGYGEWLIPTLSSLPDPVIDQIVGILFWPKDATIPN